MEGYCSSLVCSGLHNKGIKADPNHAGHMGWFSHKLIGGVVWAAYPGVKPRENIMRRVILIFLIAASFCVLPLAVHSEEGISGVISLSKDAVVALVAKLVDNQFVILGSGFFVSENGMITTCDHVTKEAQQVFVMEPSDLEKSSLLGYIQTKDKQPQVNLPVYQAKDVKAFVPAKILISSAESDVSLLQIDRKSKSYLQIGRYESIEEGNDLIFMGFPFGVNRIVTHKGMVSYKGQINISGSSGGKSIAAVQIDGIVNRGNSGGPLISVSQGKVVGVIKATYGNVGPYLQSINEGKIRAEGIGLGQIDFGIFTREVTSAIDRHIQMGIGYAVSANYITDLMKNAQTTTEPKSDK